MAIRLTFEEILQLETLSEQLAAAEALERALGEQLQEKQSEFDEQSKRLVAVEKRAIELQAIFFKRRCFRYFI